MKKLLFSNILIWLLCIITYSQADTISTNIYQNDGNLGIGTSSPSAALEINGNIGTGIERNLLKINNLNNSYKAYTGILLKSGNGEKQSVIQDYSINYTASPAYDFAGFLNIGNNSRGIMLNTVHDGVIKFYTGFDEADGAGIERMRINADGNVGIGTVNPLTPLDINGGLRIGNSTLEYEGTLRWTGNDFEGYNGSSWVSFTEQQPSVDNNWLPNGGNIYFNTGKVGIGTSSPSAALEINGNIGTGIERNLLKINNLNDSYKAYTGILLKSGNGEKQSVIQDYSINYTASPAYDFAGFLNIGNNSRGIMLNTVHDGVIKFYTGFDEADGAGIERMRIDAEGNVGIGTTNPVTKLQVTDGDIYISDIEKGIIMKSPNDQCWRGTINDSGILEFKAVDCPDVEEKKLPTSVDNAALNQNIKIFPNPTSGVLSIETDNYQFSKINYSIMDLSGKTVQKGKITSPTSVVNIETLDSGIYLFEMKDHNKILASEKISVQ